MKLNIDKILKTVQPGPSKWELENIVWHDRSSNPKVLLDFLNRIKELEGMKKIPEAEANELKYLLEMASELDEEECIELLSKEDEIVAQNFIENQARTNALEVLTKGRISFETMEIMCRLSPEDFILTSKRTQDLINSIQELVVKGETLADEMAGA
jgi:hypothetical protein